MSVEKAFGGVLDAPTVVYRSVSVAVIPLADADTGGGAFSWLNPENGPILIIDHRFDITTVASAACQLDVGTTIVSAATLSDNLNDGLDVHTATGLFDITNQTGANGKTMQRLAAGGWVTGSKASGAASGLGGFVYIHYVLSSE